MSSYLDQAMQAMWLNHAIISHLLVVGTKETVAWLYHSSLPGGQKMFSEKEHESGG